MKIQLEFLGDYSTVSIPGLKRGAVATAVLCLAAACVGLFSTYGPVRVFLAAVLLGSALAVPAKETTTPKSAAAYGALVGLVVTGVAVLATPSNFHHQNLCCAVAVVLLGSALCGAVAAGIYYAAGCR